VSFLKHLYEQIETAFRENPYRFFTEHDLHFELSRIATEFLRNEGSLFAKTCDEPKNFVLSRVHHEYPTPFRCHMKGSNFRLIKEDEYRARKLRDPKFRARRGWIDFVVLNSGFVFSNRLRVISGKMYRDFLASLKEKQHTALDLAVEVVYFPTFDEKRHIGIMRRKVGSTMQDYNKLVAVKQFAYLDGTPFCREAAMMLFSNTIHKNKLNEILASFPLRKEVSFFSIIASDSP